MLAAPQRLIVAYQPVIHPAHRLPRPWLNACCLAPWSPGEDGAPCPALEDLARAWQVQAAGPRLALVQIELDELAFARRPLGAAPGYLLLYSQVTPAGRRPATSQVRA